MNLVDDDDMLRCHSYLGLVLHSFQISLTSNPCVLLFCKYLSQIPAENYKHLILELYSSKNMFQDFLLKTRNIYSLHFTFLKNILQDFLLKTTNLMTYAARDKNSLLNFLDENLVICFQFLKTCKFVPSFSPNEDPLMCASVLT